jgi:hypothetical protein
MAQPTFVRDALALTLAGLLAWSIAQLAQPLGLPVVATGTAGVAAAGLVVASWVRNRGREDGPRAPLPTLARGQTLGILSAVVGVAFVLRAYNLMERPAWEDEMWTLRNIYTADYLELLRVAAEDYWPPLHYLVLNTLARITDTGLFWLRSPSVVFGVITVGLVGWVGMRIFRSRIAGLAAAVVLAGATTHVLYSQEARVYSLLMMLTVLSSYFFLKSHRERRISVAYIGVTTLMVYSHSFVSWYFIAAQSFYVLLAWILWRDREAFVKGFLSQLLVLILWLPLVASFVWARSARGIVVPTQWATGAENLPGPLATMELYQGLAVRSWAGAAFMALILIVAALPVVTGASPDRAVDDEVDGSRGSDGAPSDYVRTALFLCSWITVPVLFSLVVTWFTSLDTFGAVRYHLPVLPGIALLAGGGFLFLRSREAVLSAAVILVLLPMAELPRYYRDFNRPAVDEVAEIVRANEVGSETFYIGNSFRVFQYYYRGFFPRIGSETWDSLTAAHAHLTDLHTTFATKWGDTYAYERMDERITHFGYDGYEGYVQKIRDELARGGFREPYWMVLQPGFKEDQFAAAWEDLGVPCTRRVDYQPRGMHVWHCRGPEDPISPGGEAPVDR